MYFLVAKFDCPEEILCGGQDVKVQLLVLPLELQLDVNKMER